MRNKRDRKESRRVVGFVNPLKSVESIFVKVKVMERNRVVAVVTGANGSVSLADDPKGEI